MSLYPELDDGDAYAPALSSLRHQVQRTNANEFLLPYDDETVTECVSCCSAPASRTWSRRWWS